MNKMYASTHIVFTAVFAAMLAVAGCNSNQTTGTSPVPDNAAPAILSAQPITLPVGTPLHIVLGQTLSSATNNAGDEFDASISEPVELDGKTAIPSGARVH